MITDNPNGNSEGNFFISVGEVLRRFEDLQPNRTHSTLHVVTSSLSEVLKMPLDETSIFDVEENIPKVRNDLAHVGLSSGKRGNCIRKLRDLIRFGKAQPPLLIGPGNLVTVEDLMRLLPQDSSASGYRTAIKHAYACRSPSPVDFRIELLLTIPMDLPPYAKEIHLARQSLNQYTHRVYELVRFAESKGWRPPTDPVRDAWNSVAPALTSTSSLKVIEFAIWKLISPLEITESHLDDFVAYFVASGKTDKRARDICSSFKRDVADAGIESVFPHVDFRRYQSWWNYSLPLEHFPENIRNEILALKDWKVSVWEPDRPAKARHRLISALYLVQIICRLQGYVVNVLKQPPVEALAKLVSEPLLTDYVRWFTTVRHDPDHLTNLKIDLGFVRAAVTRYQGLKGIDFAWFHKLLKTIKCPGASELRRRRKLRSVRPELVDDLLDKMKGAVNETITEA